MARPANAYPWHAHLLLWSPARVTASLQQIAAAGVVPHTPNLWQVELGVLRMLHRIVFRSETVGQSHDQPPRTSWRAQIWRLRPLRAPFLLAHGALRPWDLSGLASQPDDIAQHLLGTHHERLQFVYDLHILALYPGALSTLRERAHAVVTGADPAATWRRDLCVYENYHESLLAELDRVLGEGFALPDAPARNPDVSLHAWLTWCARQPQTPQAAWTAWRRGELSFAGGLLPVAE